MRHSLARAYLCTRLASSPRSSTQRKRGVSFGDMPFPTPTRRPCATSRPRSFGALCSQRWMRMRIVERGIFDQLLSAMMQGGSPLVAGGYMTPSCASPPTYSCCGRLALSHAVIRWSGCAISSRRMQACADCRRSASSLPSPPYGRWCSRVRMCLRLTSMLLCETAKSGCARRRVSRCACPMARRRCFAFAWPSTAFVRVRASGPPRFASGCSPGNTKAIIPSGGLSLTRTSFSGVGKRAPSWFALGGRHLHGALVC